MRLKCLAALAVLGIVAAGAGYAAEPLDLDAVFGNAGTDNQVFASAVPSASQRSSAFGHHRDAFVVPVEAFYLPPAPDGADAGDAASSSDDARKSTGADTEQQATDADGKQGDAKKKDNDEDEERDADDFEKRLKKLEDNWKKLDEGWEKLDSAWSDFEEAEAKKKADAAKKPTFKINGRIHADLWDFLNDSDGVGFFEHPVTAPPLAINGTDPEDRFAFRRIRLEMGGDILEPMLWRIQMDFNNPNSVEMKDVYLGFRNLPNNHLLLIGNQKRPIGLDHLNSSRYNVFLERPMVVEAFNEDARRPGICMYGHTDDESYNWRYGAYYLENITGEGRYNGDSRQMSGNARLASSPWYDDSSDGRGYFHWAVAGMIARPDGDRTAADTNQNEGRFRTRPEARSDSRWLDTGRIAGADAYEILALESMLNIGPLQLTGEFQQTFMQRDGFSDVQFHGGYVYASYFLTGEHIPYDRKSGTIGRVKPFENFFLVDRCDGETGHGWGAWAIAARYSYLDLSDADVLGGVGESGTLALNWYWTAYSKLQFNLIYGDIHNHAPSGGYTSGNYLIAGTRFAIEF